MTLVVLAIGYLCQDPSLPDTYDVQSVSGRAIPGGLNLSCTFVEGSQAQSCILTVCIDGTRPEICRSINVSREDPQTSGHLIGLEPGLYTVREVAEIESDGQVTVHIRRDVLKLQITKPLSTTTSTILGYYSLIKLIIMSKNFLFYRNIVN